MRSREDELAGCPPLLRTLVAAYDFEGDGILDAIPFRFIHEPGDRNQARAFCYVLSAHTRERAPSK